MEGYQNTPLLQEPVPDPDNRLPEISLSPDTVLQLAPNFLVMSSSTHRPGR